MHSYPFLLDPVAKSALWGGARLCRDWGKHTDLANIAETWELSVREHERAVIRNGVYAGMTLFDVLEKMGNRAIGRDFKGGRFPLLIKFIDAEDRLSVQVHPDDAAAAEAEDGVGKTEMWHIVEAREGAQILYGLREGVTSADYAAAVARGDFLSLLRTKTVHTGETYFIPAGMPHAIGAGILIAEIQQNCDLTYRVFDYDRVGADGKKRPLHVKEALRVIRPFSATEIDAIQYARGAGGGVLCSCPYFRVERLLLDGALTRAADTNSFHSLLVLTGGGCVQTPNACVEFKKGDSLFLPADTGTYTLSGNATLLLTTL